MNQLFLRPALLIAFVCSFAPAFSQTAAPIPAPQPATEPAPDAADVARIQKVFNRLAAPDALLRDAARDNLMGLDRSDLAALREVVKKSLPLQPSQTAVLREVVIQAFLSQEPYDADPNNPNRGFLGIRFDPEQEYFEFGLNGVEIRHRMPGFCAYRSLRDGDVVKAIVMDPPRPLHNSGELIEAMKEFTAGQVVVFQVLREGKLIRVALRLDQRPMVGLGNPEAFLAPRQRAAQEYWEHEFEPLVENDAL